MTIGAVVIGRNEGSRLSACLSSVQAQLHTIVYVDSGSSDDSVAVARRFGVDVVTLVPARGYTAARARNAGFARLLLLDPDVTEVMFVDGDCEIAGGWVAWAADYLRSDPGVGIVCGRRRERHPEASPFNRLCDFEWDTPVGSAETCGGDALVRAAAFRDGGGFAAELIAGEEPDLCHRIRQAGWTIHRLDREMTTHDAAMARWDQWWQRNRRSGYAYAQALTRRGRGDRRMLRGVLSNVFWALPLAWPLWPMLWWRIMRRRGAFYAFYVTIGKVPQCHGQLDFWLRRRRGLIEYK